MPYEITTTRDLRRYEHEKNCIDAVVCVDTTVRAAMDHGYHVKLVSGACATMDLELNGEIIPAETVQKAFIASLNGVFATVI
jgi:Amidases related to nicotinamidase